MSVQGVHPDVRRRQRFRRHVRDRRGQGGHLDHRNHRDGHLDHLGRRDGRGRRDLLVHRDRLDGWASGPEWGEGHGHLGHLGHQDQHRGRQDEVLGVRHRGVGSGTGCYRQDGDEAWACLPDWAPEVRP